MSTRHGFELIKEKVLSELNTEARFYRHVETSAELLSLENEDENKVFGITFRTPPKDSTGVAHIMEHSVLSGSEKYPLKEPFVELLKGSLYTFLNAMTYPDKTCYPVASQNLKDFYNLIDVYMDAVLHPLNRKHTLDQEGWHYELEKIDDPLACKGVVYNEMKGVYSDPDSVLAEYSQQFLFPDNTYGVNSGGEPAHIPDLTYDQFKSFHSQYYHPSNARIFIYGDDGPDERLRLMNEYLRGYGRIEVHSQIGLQKYFEKPKSFKLPYIAGDEATHKKSMLTVNWILGDNTDPETGLVLAILSHILVGTPASTLRKILIDSGLGEDLTGVGLEDELRQPFFSTGLKGIASEDSAKVEELVLGTLEKLVKDGIERDAVEASVNTVEFRLRENNTGGYPRGLILMLRSLTTWLHEGDPLSILTFDSILASIKKRLSEGERVFENMISRYFLENLHRTSVLLEPDPELLNKEKEKEKQRLDEARSAMGRENIEKIINQTKRLRELQEVQDPPEMLARIPRLGLNDIDRRIKTIPIEVTESGKCSVLYHDLLTSGITYLDIGFNLHNLPQEYLPYVSLFGRALVEMGTGKEDFVKLSRRIGRETGGITSSVFTSTVYGSTESAAWLFLRGKSTVSQTENLLAILKDLLLDVRLDNKERFQQIVLEAKAAKESALVPGGHRVVGKRLASKFSEAGWAGEQINGLSNLFFVRKLADNFEKDWPGVLTILETMQRLLLKRSGMICNTTLTGEDWRMVKPRLEDFIGAFPESPAEPQTWSSRPDPPFEGLVIPSQVNFVGKAANLYESGYELNGSAFVAGKFLRTTWLWEKIRVQGGAYGSFLTFNPNTGVLTYLSYRDPNLLATLDNFDNTGSFLSNVEISTDELTRAIIGAVGNMDAYLLPDAKGHISMNRYLTANTDDFRQKMRDQVLSTTGQDFKTFAGILSEVKGRGKIVVLGAPEIIDSANRDRGNFLSVLKVL